MGLILGTYADDGGVLDIDMRVHTDTLAIMAKKGGGKTYTAGVMEEEMARLGLPFIVLDPVGVHHGIRSKADGRTPAYPIVVFGGAHGDIEIDREMGPEIARLLVAQPISAIIDVSELSKAGFRRFVGEFADTLYSENRPADGRGHPVHLFIEEAVEFLPQTIRPDMAVTYEAVERIVRLGRNRGIGITLISQRPAQLNKDVLSMIDILIALQTVGPQDVKALTSMFAAQLSKAQWQNDLAQFESEIAELPPGTAFFWWPTQQIFRKVKIRARETYHAGATPSFQATEQIVMAKPDVEAIRALLAKPAAPEVPAGKAKPESTELAQVRAALAASQTEARKLQDGITAAKAREQSAWASVEQHREDLAKWQSNYEALEAEAETDRRIATLLRNLMGLLGAEPPMVISSSEASPEKIRAIVEQMLAGNPRSLAPQVVLPPAEVILKRYQLQAVDRLMAKIDGAQLAADERECLRYLLAKQPAFITNRAIGVALSGSTGEGTRLKWGTITTRLRGLGLIESGHSGGYRPALETLIKEALKGHDVTDEERAEIEQQVLARLVQED